MGFFDIGTVQSSLIRSGHWNRRIFLIRNAAFDDISTADHHHFGDRGGLPMALDSSMVVSLLLRRRFQ